MKKNTQATGQVKDLRTMIGLGAGALFAIMAATPAQAVPPITNSFAFGPGTTLDHSCERTFYIPAGSTMIFAWIPPALFRWAAIRDMMMKSRSAG